MEEKQYKNKLTGCGWVVLIAGVLFSIGILFPLNIFSARKD